MGGPADTSTPLPADSATGAVTDPAAGAAGAGPDAGAAGLTTGAVARRLGVAPTTLRSWDRRYGIGPAVREGGRHRRWSPADVAVLEAMCRLTGSGVPPAEAARQALAARQASGPGRRDARRPGNDVRPGSDVRPPGGAAPAQRPERTGPRSPAHRPGGSNALPLGNVRQECRGLAGAAVRLDAAAVDGLLEAVLAEHGLVASWEDVITPALRAVGRKWAASTERPGERYVEVEHLLSWHVSSALRRVVTHPPVRPRGAPVLLACTPGETHTLSLEALAAGLAERGLPVRMFGASVPAEALDRAVRRTGPAAVVLWSQSRPTADRALAVRVGATAWGVRGARTRPAVAVAGPGWAGGTPPAGTLRPRGLREALDTLVAVCAR
ncbi:MerR family transcriptional regulator [Streptomyces sp. NPDC059637]|uniref:MerR family transcriptional regulator n=1 Tax=Streptomyces sp. NPDC059637 TaxID=3347752 RepID=UPI0036C68CAC